MVHDNDETKGVTQKRGFPNPATDSTIISLDINELLVDHPSSTFFMQVVGDDMQSLGIFDGDVAVVDKALEPRKGDYVIWWNDAAFVICKATELPTDTVAWGVVTTIIHRFRK